MQKEYKYCPKCHIINSPDAKSCECGYSFASDGGALTDEELSAVLKKKKRRKSVASLIITALTLAFFALAYRFGLIVLLVALAFAAVLLLIATAAYKIKNEINKNRSEDD